MPPPPRKSVPTKKSPAVKMPTLGCAPWVRYSSTARPRRTGGRRARGRSRSRARRGRRGAPPAACSRPLRSQGSRRGPARSRVENIGPMASACATAWIVERFFSPSFAWAVEPVDSWSSSSAAGAPCAGDEGGIKVRTSNVNRHRRCRMRAADVPGHVARFAVGAAGMARIAYVPSRRKGTGLRARHEPRSRR